MSVLGLTLRDLMPDRDGPVPNRNGKPKSYPKTFPTANAAVEKLERRHGKRSAMWTYHNVSGEPVGLVVRWDLPDGKKDNRFIWLLVKRSKLLPFGGQKSRW